MLSHVRIVRDGAMILDKKRLMVQLMKSGDFLLETEAETAAYRDKITVKREIEDAFKGESGQLNKRSKLPFTEWNHGDEVLQIPPSQYNPLDEPSPLGLQLRKSPSLLDLIQMKLSQASNSSRTTVQNESCNSVVKKEDKGTATGTTDKLKASNFPASLLKIGSWEYKSRYEGDLVAKCYFAKHKLVWEVLDGGLKSKIEIQWSDIMALAANCSDTGPSTLNVVLARQPLFFRETNPQPRKHTLWQATADFTDGQASIYKQHFVQCPQGLLSKHFEKLIQCDMRLNFLSRQPEMPLDSPYFELRASVFEYPEESKTHCFDQSENGKGSIIFHLSDGASPSAQSSSLRIEQQDSSGIVLDRHSQEAPSPSSVMDSRAIEGNENSEVVNSKSPRNLDQIKVPGLHPSMSMSDLVNHIGNCLSEQITSSNPSFQGEGSEYQNILEDIAQYLLSDNQLTTASDEKSLMTRVNSLCCLLQKDPTVKTLQGEGHAEGTESGKNVKQGHLSEAMDGGCMRGEDVKENKQASSAMSRKDSFGELLLHLPRIASLPKFLFNISEEDGDSQDR